MELPLAYQKGFVEFLGAKIDLRKRPFIPREETEYWVSGAIEEMKVFIGESKAEKIDCLDIFSGSGCIGIALLKNIPEVACDFAEADDGFLDQIKINLKLNNIDPARYRVIKSDVFFGIDGKYDFILANPPYIAEERVDELGEDVKRHEPAIALMAGEKGMDFIKIFLEDVYDYLKDRGMVFMEMDSEQKDPIIKVLNSLPMEKKYSSFVFLNDQFGKPRVLRIVK
ncbi:MAG: HemK family protein methyltransferase [Candidatus Paceibacterota bacterium]